MSSALDTLLHLEAADSGLVQARATRRHVHLDANPMAVAVYKLAGDAASPVAIIYGTDALRPRLLVAPEPRSREIRFELLNQFMPDLLMWMHGRPDGTAPQLLVANPSSGAFLGLLGRSLRHPPRDGSVPLDTVLAARHLAWLDERSEHPGGTVILPLTAVLAQHWRTGQSDLEDAQLATLLAWIDPGEGIDGRAAARLAERARRSTPAGPSSDPGWDERLDTLVRGFNQSRNGATDPATVRRYAGPVEELCRDALERTWQDLWHGHGLLAALPEGAHVPARWADDAEAWAWWRTYAEGPDARIANTDSPRRAAMLLDARERSQDALEVQQAVDDPLRFAALEADGRALRGTVTGADYSRRVIPPGKVRNVTRPLLTLTLDGPSPVRVDTSLWNVEDPRVTAHVVDVREDASGMDVELDGGMRPRSGPPVTLPKLGETARFTTSSVTPQQPTPMHDLRRAWTHRLPTEARPDAAVDTDATPAPAVTS